MPNPTYPMPPRTYFFRPVSATIIPMNVLHNFINKVDKQILNVPNLGVGNVNINIRKLRCLIHINRNLFQNLNIASAYYSWLYRTAQCGELANITYIYLEPLLPPGTILEKFVAWWPHDNHVYIKIKLPVGYMWEDGGNVRFCDVWYKKLNPRSSGVYTDYEINTALRDIGFGSMPSHILRANSKIVPLHVPASTSLQPQ